MGVELEEDAIALYDRQIRLWGAAAQAKLGKSRIALIGAGGVGSEIAKNLVLGGVGGLVVIDNTITSIEEPGFLIDIKRDVGISRAIAVKDKLSELNPRVKVSTINDDWRNLDVDTFWKDFDVIIGTQLSAKGIEKLNEISRNCNIPLLVSACHGLFSMVFIDAISTQSWITKEKMPNRKLGSLDAWGLREIVHFEDIEENGVQWDRCLVKSTFRPWNTVSSRYIHDMYPNERRLLKRISPVFIGIMALLEIIDDDDKLTLDKLKVKGRKIIDNFKLPTKLLDEDVLKRVLNHYNTNFQPTSAIIGGLVAQTTINIIVQRELAPNNFILLDGYNNEMPIFTI